MSIMESTRRDSPVTFECPECGRDDLSSRIHDAGQYTVGIAIGMDKVELAVECPNDHKFTPSQPNVFLGLPGVEAAIEQMIYDNLRLRGKSA